jgi:hypothetical protein
MLMLINRKMFVRVNKVDGVPDDNGGKGGWWTVNVGVHDEGRPGRKSKGKKRSGEEVDEMPGEHARDEEPAGGSNALPNGHGGSMMAPHPHQAVPSEKAGMLRLDNASSLGLGVGVELPPSAL